MNHPIKWVKLNRFCDLSGYTEKAIAGKIATGIWVENTEYRYAPDGKIQVNLEAYEKWVESGQGSRYARKTSESASSTEANDAGNH